MLRYLTRIAFVFAVVVYATGCGNEIKIVPVSGIVLIDGQPLTHGQIQVAPVGARPAYAKIGPDGRFTLGTNGDADGVSVGIHPVAVIAHQSLTAGSQKWHAPKKYMSTETSGLMITVEKATNDLVVNISWEGGKPFVERGEKE